MCLVFIPQILQGSTQGLICDQPKVLLTPNAMEARFVIDTGLNAVSRVTTAASGQDFHLQAILKLHRLSSLDYSACHGITVYN